MLITNATVATMSTSATALDQPYQLITHGAIAINDKKIDWIGPASDLPGRYKTSDTTDLKGRLVTPAFIDCHTHIVHGSNRANEFEQRLNGASYEEVARAGGGIISTVKSTRESSLTELIETALPRVDALLAEGVSLIEVKSGYGLDLTTELNMLRAARALEQHRPVRVKTSFLGAHAVPATHKDNSDSYIDEVCIPALRAAHRENLVDAVDGFCEGIAYTTAQIERVFKEAQRLGLPVKLHAEQLSRLGGTQLAARFHALSADHLEYASEADAKAMAISGTVAVLLPGAFYTVRETQTPPIEQFRKYNVPIALATDCNPGSSPLTSLLLTMNMACTLFRMTPEESLAAVTRNAAQALGIKDTGRIEPGLRADLSVWNVEHPAELSYRIGFNPLHSSYFAGVTTGSST